MNLIKNESIVKKLVQNSILYYSSETSNGIKCHGFTYYPRFPDHKDPPYQPAKLFLLKKMRPVKGNPYWEKQILKDFKLDGSMSQVAVVKNTPETNLRLWKIKHLVQITPITFPNGEPSVDDANSLGATYINEHGEMTVKPRLSPITTQQIEAPKQRPGGETLRRHLSLKWQSGMY